ncbi:hypothetical protein F2S72_28175 [Pseudomonas syringae pv. actinidiae]|nr:hypothetical protein [Pseudomonas syringae pv. actinidiae]
MDSLGGASAGFAGGAVAERFGLVVLSNWALGEGLAAGSTGQAREQALSRGQREARGHG